MGSCSSCIKACLTRFQGRVDAGRVKSTINTAVVDEIDSIRNQEQKVIYGEIIIQLGPEKSSPRKATSVRLYSSSDIDPDTGRGKLTKKAVLKHGKVDKTMQSDCGAKVLRYELKFKVEPDFGVPGALVIKNVHKHEFFLRSASLQVCHSQSIHFKCNSWIYPFHLTNQDRIFFKNTCFLPNQTPGGLVGLRKEELMRLRGDGTGERQEWDQIYDYDCYNYLNNTDRGQEYDRPVLGGSESYPYPRRLRTGRPSRNHECPPGVWFNTDTYVPPDERFSQKKLLEVTSNIIRAAMQFVIPEARQMLNKESSQIESFDQIHNLFASSRGQVVDEWLVKHMRQILPGDLFEKVKQIMKQSSPIKFPLPRIAAGNQFAWMDDEEFGRQMLAGTNPTVITCLPRFPPESVNGVESSIRQWHIEHNLDGMTVKEAMKQWRIFILDHHYYLMPFLRRINAKGLRAYASRTLLFLRDDSTLKPVAIELTLPGYSRREEINRVFCSASNGTEAALWQLAKAHVSANDSCYHHLINHWLKTHAVVEPFIIATQRQLSAMHPIHWLLNPHFKDTLQVNALARGMVLNAGGILENILFTGPISMELSSFLYKNWRFDEQSLPFDLIKRGMAIQNPNQPANIELLFEDYPYAADGLDIWLAIKTWVAEYCSYYYQDTVSITSDYEIQEWWSEIRHVGHGDKRNERWWYDMTTVSKLVEALTTLIWIVTALHAAVTLGQYEYGGYPPNRPTACQKPIPEEGTMEFAEFLRNPDKYFLQMLPGKLEMSLGIALVEVLSRHVPDEPCLGQQIPPKWIDDERIHLSFKKFRDELKRVEEIIKARNRNPKLKNRQGRVNIPYELLCPHATEVRPSDEILSKGIPNSISI